VPPLEAVRVNFINDFFSLASRVGTRLVPLLPGYRPATSPLPHISFRKTINTFAWVQNDGTMGFEWMVGTRVPSPSPTRDARAWVRPRAGVNPYLETSCVFGHVRAPT